MKRLLVSLFIIAFGFSFLSYAQEAGTKKVTPKVEVETKENIKATKTTRTTPSKTKKSSKPIKGRVVSLVQMFLDKVGKVTKEEAMKQAEEGKPIVFLVGKGKKAKVYFVFNEDGSFAGKKLAKFADNKFVGIVGKTKIINGLNFIVAEIIESMD